MMVQVRVQTGAVSQYDGYHGTLEPVSGGDNVWTCEHQHGDDISAEFCALDFLINEAVVVDDDAEFEDGEDEEGFA